MSRIGERIHQHSIQSRVAATSKEVVDLVEGNKDGLWGNEGKPAGTTGSFFDRNAVSLILRGAFAGKTDTEKQLASFQTFLDEVQKADPLKRPVVEPAARAKLKDPVLFETQKAVALLSLGRRPADVKDMFISAGGKVDGKEVPTRDVFAQHFPPTGTPRQEFVVVSPGFLETGRNYLEVADQLSKQGFDVLVMDHQWAGQSEGIPGGIHSGESIALATAAVAAQANRMAKERYGDEGRLASLLGVSMGGGPGATGAAMMNMAGRLQLDGPDKMPTDVDVACQGAYFKATHNVQNVFVGLLSRLIGVRRQALPHLGLPDLTDNKRAEQRGAQIMALEGTVARPDAFPASDDFIKKVFSVATDVSRDLGPSGPRFVFLHGTDDDLASRKEMERFAATLGKNVETRPVKTNNHTMSLDPEQQKLMVQMVVDLSDRRRAERAAA